MKRQALGKGLGALIPGGQGTEVLSKSGAKASHQSHPSESDRTQSVSAADMAGAVADSSLKPLEAPDASRTAPPQGPGSDRALSASSNDALTAAASEVDRVPGNALFQWLDIDRIRPNPLQPRRQFPPEQIEELASSIRASGVLQPILVRRIEDGYGLIAGERRWRAAQRAGLHKVPALIREASDDHLLQIALVENLQRQDLNPMEEARAYSSLIKDFGLTQVEVAERVGRQRSSVANSLRLLNLPTRVQDLVENGTLTMGHARALASLPHGKAQEIAAGLITERGLSVRETEAWVARHTTPPPEPSGIPRVDPNVRAAADNLQRSLGTKVQIRAGRGEGGMIVIQYHSPAELQRLYLRLSKT